MESKSHPAENSLAPSSALMHELVEVTRELASTQDEDYLLDRILTKARQLLGAEAGSIFLVRDNKLNFTYVQNDKLFEGSTDLRDSYTTKPMAIDKTSLAGYAAATGEILNIPDVYLIPEDAPYSFNKSYDEATGYRTCSMLVVPLISGQGDTIGVLQLINAMTQDECVLPFDQQAEDLAMFFANNAAFALERAMMTRALILRTMRMAELRDPKETGAHVNRVGGYAAIIYKAWAQAQGVPQEEIDKNQDLIRVAAMLHDVGKVAISDSVLKKPGKLNDEEYDHIKTHTLKGAQLFGLPTSEMDQLAQTIALNHHERWDGKGYPGQMEDFLDPEAQMGPGKLAEEPPLAARITALADVYDALCSRRSYKDPWPEEKVLAIIKEESGKQFDPDVVEAFFKTHEEIQAVRRRYQDSD